MNYKKIKIADIARAANVSLMTVSRVINGKSGVSTAVRHKIEKLANDLGYVPSRPSFPLGQKGSSKTVGVLIPHLANTIFPVILQNIENILSLDGYRILLCCTYNDPIKEFHDVSALLERQVDGIIWSPVLMKESDKSARLILKQKCPLVFLDRIIPHISADSVLVDDFEGAYAATLHLLKQGIRRIAHLAPRTDSYVAHERKRGYLAALSRYRIAEKDAMILKVGSEVQHGKTGMAHLLDKGNKIEAVFCFNDPIALGAYITLREYKVKVPEEVALIGFSATIESELTDVPISSVYQDAPNLGITAANLLLNRMINPNISLTPIKKVLKTRLIIRESSMRNR